MRYALVDGVRAEATPKGRGTCDHCGSEMIAKCGRVVVRHWAHRNREACDSWWESETIWHREWKDRFPRAWQEVSHADGETGETHIADVKNPFGLVIEFQHSVLAAEERIAREAFYGDIIWVVDGLRNELDASHFKMGLGREPLQRDPLAFPIAWWSRSRLLHTWSQATAKVYLDFGDEWLWRLISFDRNQGVGVVGPVPKQTFVEDCLVGTSIRVSLLSDEDEGGTGTRSDGP